MVEANIMKILFSFLFTLILISTSTAQENPDLSKSEIRRFEKQQKKAQKQAELELWARQTHQILKQRKYVLEAEYMSDRDGSRKKVSSNANHIIVDSIRGSFQLLDGYYRINHEAIFNGNEEGIIGKYNIDPMGKKKDKFNVDISIACVARIYHINLTKVVILLERSFRSV
jgi:hypothetical protein